MPNEGGRLETAIWLDLSAARDGLTAIHREFAPAAAAKLKPFHITLLYPFVIRDKVDEDVHSRLGRVFESQRPLAFSLAQVEEFPEAGVVYVRPDPATELRACMTRLWSEFEETPPYGGRHGGRLADPTPHATLGYVKDEVKRGEVRTRASALLPVNVVLTYASLWEEVEPNRWRERERFNFATNSGM